LSTKPVLPISPRNATSTFWTNSLGTLFSTLYCGADGLTAAEAAGRLKQFGPNSDVGTRADGLGRAILRRLLEPLSLILLVAGAVSAATGDVAGGLIIVSILSLSIGLDTVQEGHAVKAAEVLRKSVALRAEVKRNGAFVDVDVSKVVPGDINSNRGNFLHGRFSCLRLPTTAIWHH
jgi:Mg2+-importing ATPase